MTRLRALAAAALALASAGCRYNLEHVHEGRALPAREVARLQPGTTTLAQALAIVGAPDGLLWTPQSDVLVYDHVERFQSKWELENPVTFLGRITPQAVAGEAVTFVLYAAARSGQPVPIPARRRRLPGPQTIPTFTTRPLTLEGEAVGREQVLLVFERETQVLRAVEVATGRPVGGVLGVTRSTFLR